MCADKVQAASFCIQTSARPVSEALGFAIAKQSCLDRLQEVPTATTAFRPAFDCCRHIRALENGYALWVCPSV